MNLRVAVFAALAAVPQIGCATTCSWGYPRDRETVSGVAEAEALQQAAEQAHSSGADDEEAFVCEAMCQAAYGPEDGGPRGIRKIRSCTLDRAAASVTCDVVTEPRVCKGRRPVGHMEFTGVRGADPLGQSLAAMAYLEAASVDAFEELASQLEDFSAPQQLIARARACAADERRHTLWLTQYAERNGARVPSPRAVPAATHLEAIARHNATEGCIFESFAALIAHRAADRCDDAGLRSIFAKIADDETRHGQFAWDLHEWFKTRLSTSQRRAIAAAQEAALQELPRRAREMAGLLEPVLHIGADENASLALAFSSELA